MLFIYLSIYVIIVLGPSSVIDVGTTSSSRSKSKLKRPSDEIIHSRMEIEQKFINDFPVNSDKFSITIGSNVSYNLIEVCLNLIIFLGI